MNGQDIGDRGRYPVLAVVLIAVGVVLVLFEIFNVRLGNGWWPLFILLPGLALLGVAFAGRSANAGLAIAGAILTTLALIFIYQERADHWESWAYIWALFPVATGLALIAAGSRNDDQGTISGGVETARWGGIAFVIGLVFFEFFIFGGLSGYVVPGILIAIGAFMLWNQTRNRGDDAVGGPFERSTSPPRPAALRPTPAPSAPSRPSVPAPPSSAPPMSASPPSGRAAAPPPSPGPTTPTYTPAPPPIIPVPAMPSGAAMPPPLPVEPIPPFPPDELPHEPPPLDAPFPPDEHSPGAMDAGKPRGRVTRPRRPRTP